MFLGVELAIVNVDLALQLVDLLLPPFLLGAKIGLELAQFLYART